MRKSMIFLAGLWLSLPLAAQDDVGGQRANHYIDHVVLGIKDLDAGVEAFRRLTGVKPRYDGQDPQLGTHSAIVGLGDDTFLEITAPDPEADPDSIDPEIRSRTYNLLVNLETLTPVRWAIGTENLEKSILFTRRAGGYAQQAMPGVRSRSWGRTVEWSWSYVDRPTTPVMPLLVEWSADTKRPQDRAPKGCELTALQIQSRFFKPIQAMIVTLQVDAEPLGADVDALRFALECKGEEVVFEPVPLEIIKTSRRGDGAK